MQLPLSIFGVATAAAVLTAISSAAARQDLEAVREGLMRGLRQCFFLVMPSMLGLIVLGRPIVRLLFERGEFTATDTDQTATALALYALGLLSFSFVKVSVTGFYSLKDTKSPVIVASISMVLNIVLNCLLVRHFAFRGLAIATSISFTVNFLVLFVLLCDRFGRLWDAAFITALIRMTAAAGTAIALAYGAYRALAGPEPAVDLHARLLCVLVPVSVACGAYLLLCLLLDVEEVRQVFRIIWSRARGSR